MHSSYNVGLILIIIANFKISVNSLDDLRFRIESTSFEPCPHIRNGRLVSDTSKIDFSQSQYSLAKYGVARLSRLRIIDQHGVTKDLNLPGCFNVRIDAVFSQNIDNPYVEAFIKSDREEPCRRLKDNPYCPATDNEMVRLMTQNQVTCRFCDFCLTTEELAEKLKTGNTGVTLTVSNGCSGNVNRIQAGQNYPFELNNICTPTSEEIDRQLTQKFGPSWHDVDFIRRGTIIFTVHFMNRRNLAPPSCLKLGSGTYEWKGSSSLQGGVRANLENTCRRYRNPFSNDADKPQDEYLGCYTGYINYAIDRLQQ